MERLMCLVIVTVLVICHHSVDSSTAEITAGKAISKLLQEKISMKFKEAANEVKGVLVKHLGDSLKSAHNRMNPKKKKKILKAIHGAAVHMNKGPRHRKQAGPSVTNGSPGAKVNGQSSGPYGISLPGQPNQPAGPQGPPGSQGVPGPPGAPGSPLGPNSLPQPGQCGAQCPAVCAPACENTCCQQMAMQTPCPSPCYQSCFSYCPTNCCRHKKNGIPSIKGGETAKKE